MTRGINSHFSLVRNSITLHSHLLVHVYRMVQVDKSVVVVQRLRYSSKINDKYLIPMTNRLVVGIRCPRIVCNAKTGTGNVYIILVFTSFTVEDAVEIDSTYFARISLPVFSRCPILSILREVSGLFSNIGGQGYDRCTRSPKCESRRCKCKAVGMLCKSN